MIAGEHCLHGFTDRHIRSTLKSTLLLSSRAADPKEAGAAVGRCFKRLLAHGPIAKIPPKRLW